MDPNSFRGFRSLSFWFQVECVRQQRIGSLAVREVEDIRDDDQFVDDIYVEPNYLSNSQAARLFSRNAEVDPNGLVEVGYYHTDSDTVQYSVLEVDDNGDLKMGIG